MTYVNMKEIDRRIEARIMVLISRRPESGTQLDIIYRYFRAGGLQSTILREDIPGWLQLSDMKRGHRLNRKIQELVRSGRARIQSEGGNPLGLDEPFSPADRLVPLNVLDKLVFALEQEESEVG